VEGEIGFATQERMLNWFKTSLFDGTGVLIESPVGLQLRGRQSVFTFPHINSIDWIDTGIPWVNLGSMAVGIVLTLWLSWLGAFRFMTLDNPVTYILLSVVCAIAMASWPTNWVRLEYLDELNNSRRAYFTYSTVLARWRFGIEGLYLGLRDWHGRAGH
jgi:hypothetical protein